MLAPPTSSVTFKSVAGALRMGVTTSMSDRPDMGTSQRKKLLPLSEAFFIVVLVVNIVYLAWKVDARILAILPPFLSVIALLKLEMARVGAR